MCACIPLVHPPVGESEGLFTPSGSIFDYRCMRLLSGWIVAAIRTFCSVALSYEVPTPADPVALGKVNPVTHGPAVFDCPTILRERSVLERILIRRR